MRPTDDFVEIHRLTERAQAAGRAAVRPGVSFESIDAAARDVITAGGYGEQFFHRLGHGIGLEVHEEPYVISGNAEPAVAGNTFSVEPGIYLEGRYGVRIEDTVLCTADGCRSAQPDTARTPRPRGLIRGPSRSPMARGSAVMGHSMDRVYHPLPVTAAVR